MSPKHPDYVVHKFGGTSVANAERFIALKSLLTGKNEIIVISAVQGTTSTLQHILDEANNKKPYLKKLDALEETHVALAKTLLSAQHQQDIMQLIKKDFNELRDLLHAVQLANSYAKEIQELILGYGERWSASIVARYLAAYHKTLYLDASQVLFVYEKNNILCIDWAKSQAALDDFLRNKSFDQLIITGYIAATREGKRTTLGRNGSDFSAAIFAKLFKARELYIWTDVDGVFSADPNRVRSAFVIPSLSYKEALELAYFGAKVLHPQTIAPVLDSHIPIYIKNSFKPEAKGTCISAFPEKSAHPVKGLTSIDHIDLLNIEGAGMTGVSGIAARVFQILHQEKISVILISQASSEHSICFAIASIHTDAAIRTLTENMQFEIEKQHIEKISTIKDCAIVAAVGDGMVGAIGVSGRLFSSLAQANINIRAISQGSSERNISVVIDSSGINKALQAIHASFYLSRKTISIGLIGPGAIGSTLLAQIHAALNPLKEKYQVNLHVRGIMNSKQMLLSHEPIDLSRWRENLGKSPLPSDLDHFCSHIMADDIPHAVIIDCTANKHIAEHYIDFFNKGMHVITPNKHANAGDLDYYKKLKSLSQQKDKFYLYEATVCAGLPIINTLQDLIKTGDDIIKIEGIVSGTLSFIFSALTKGQSFSQLVLEAQKRGYTEPDPREDLSGMDVARKLVCLARECGHAVSLADAKVHDLVPQALKDCSVDVFLEKLPAYDDDINSVLAKAKSKNEKLAYAGLIHQDGSIEVAIKTFPASHPFSRMQGTDNMIIFHTKRYQELPLIIEGPGAGAEVTAGGVFADLLRLVAFIA